MPESVSINNKFLVFSFGLAKGWCSNCVVPFFVSWNPSREELSSTNYWFTPRSEVKGASQVALVVENLPANAGDIKDAGLIPGSGRSPGGGRGSPLQYSCLENPMDREAWWATVHAVTKSWTWLKWFSMQAPCKQCSKWKRTHFSIDLCKN